MQTASACQICLPIERNSSNQPPMFFAACEADLSRHGQLLVDEDDDIDHKEFRLVSVQHDQLA